MNATCPDTPALLDHMEGRADLSEHVVSCELCSQALGDLRVALDVESALVATPSLDVERALVAVKTRARKNRQSQWGMSVFFSAAAAVTLALLLPGKLAPAALPDATEGRGNSSSGPAAVNAPNFSVEVNGSLQMVDSRSINQIIHNTSTAPIHS